MSADYLRETARMMRQQARDVDERDYQRAVSKMGRRTPNGIHAATWSPAVALDVADWLDECATVRADPDVNPVLKIALTDRAFRIARVWRGDDA